MEQAGTRADTAWRKSRLAARLLLRRESGEWRPRDRALARRLAHDPEVSDRLIQQALYFLGIGTRKHDFDKKIFELVGLPLSVNNPHESVAESQTHRCRT